MISTDAHRAPSSLLAVGVGAVAALAACLFTGTQLAALLAALVASALAAALFASGRYWAIAFLAAVLCLPPLPVPIGDSGPHPALFFLAAGLAAGLVRWRQWKHPIPAESIALLAFPLVLLAGLPLAAAYSGAALALQSLLRLALFAASLYVFFYAAGGPHALTASRARKHVGALYTAAVVSAVFACADFYFQLPAPAGFGPQFIWLDFGVFRRAQGFFYEASTLGNVCAFFLVFAATGLLARKEDLPVRKYWLLAGAIPIAAALLLSFSRASLLNVAVSLSMLAALNAARLRLARVVSVLAAAVGATLAITYAAVPVFLEFYWLRLTTSFQQLLAGNEQLLSGRLETWRALAGFLADNPQHAILGIGYKTLPYSTFTGQPAVADNTYLSSLVETGLVGLAALLAMHAAVLSMAWRAHRAEGLAGLLGTWIFCFWTGEIVQMLSGDLLTYWRVLPVYFWVLAIAVRLSFLPRRA